MKFNLLLLMTAPLLLISYVEGRIFCFRRVRRRGKCGGFLRKDRYHSPQACCQGKGQGFALRKAKLGRNRFRCTPCSTLTEDENTLSVAPPFPARKHTRQTTRRPKPTTTTTNTSAQPPRTTRSTTYLPWPTPAKQDPYSMALYPPQVDEDGNVIQWEAWSPCSVSCGAGWRSRAKVCDNCDRNDYDNVQSQPCMVNFYCPVDGNWGPWFPWHACSKTCDGGTRIRQRKCNYPPPAYGGAYCPGEEKATHDCRQKPCPIDGQWGSWSEKTACSQNCGHGVTRRTRSCDSPLPQYGGRDCHGPDMVTRKCEVVKCPVDGSWSLWSSWSGCSTTCGRGFMEKTRSCDSPRPQYGGKSCEENDVERRECYAGRPCPVDGGWTSWTNYGYCRARRCKQGNQIRSRSCSNPRPSHGGKPCLGQQYERVTCINDKDCPRNGSWCEWSQWNGCSSTCQEETALQARQRECQCPSPRNEGLECSGDRFEIRECPDLPVCPTEDAQNSGDGTNFDAETEVGSINNSGGNIKTDTKTKATPDNKTDRPTDTSDSTTEKNSNSTLSSD